MKFNRLFLAALALSSICLTGCRDDFAEMNQSPSAVTEANISYLFAEAVDNFKPDWYLEYYYNAPMKYQWAGWGQSSSGAGEGMITLTATGDQGYMYLQTLKYVRDMEHALEGVSGDELLTKKPYLAAARVLTIYSAIFDTDMYGSIPYDEACTGAYDGGTITPKFDRVEDLFNEWIATLDECIADFTSSGAAMANTQDVVFGGDVAKWAKFANSLKLRIAVRLLNANPTLAKQIAANVKKASCGYIDDLSDDVMFNKATVSNENNDFVYHWENDFYGCVASKHVVDFMVGGQDPRVRFFYKKNYWNSKIVNAYLEAGLELPSFIAENVNVTTDEEGKKHFGSWAGLGEPWVRYYGITDDWNAYNEGTGKYKWYFPSNYGKAATELQIYDAEGRNGSVYTAYSTLQQMMIIGRRYTATAQCQAATLPGEAQKAYWSEDGRPWYGLYLGAGEVNLYLAEFAMLDGNEAQAKAYYEKGLRFSVQEFDKLSELNKIAYRESVKGCFTYDPNEAPIDLKDGEIDAMLATPNYAFTGTAKEKLEKIYLQEMVHFTLYPNEVYVTARRSGYPSYTSNICARPRYAEVPSEKIPRRFPTGAITEDDKMGPNRAAAYAEQGLTPTSDGLYNSVICTERLWIDKNAPAWGTPQ